VYTRVKLLTPVGDVFIMGIVAIMYCHLYGELSVMTCIAQFATKKAFKEAVENDPNDVIVEDPSIFNPFHGSLTLLLERVGDIVVTNHPKRSWFASVKWNGGLVKVS
tara:strand:- start:116 stop:436 length:321 start_codon:yes stop_codon:yes gene_type:complete